MASGGKTRKQISLLVFVRDPGPESIEVYAASATTCVSASLITRTKSTEQELQHAEALQDKSEHYYCALNTKPNKIKEKCGEAAFFFDFVWFRV